MDDLIALRDYHDSKDPEAFSYLVSSHQRMVYSVCRRLLGNAADAEDATQETFLKLAKNAGAVRGNVVAWLYTCATGTAKDLVRKEATRRRHHQAASKENSGQHRTESDELIARLDEALMQLDDADRELICSRFFASRTQSELGRAYGVSQSLISRRISVAVERLHQRMRHLGCVMPLVALAPALEAEVVRVAVPDAVNTALVKIGLSGAGSVPAVKTGGIIMALTTKAKIFLASASVILIIGGGTAVVNLRTPAHPSVQLGADLADEYELSEGENVRLLRPPFPVKRDELIKSHIDTRMAKGIERWECLFQWNDDSRGGVLQWRAGTEPRSERERLAWIAENVLGLQWYNLGEHGALKAPAGDWVVRTDITLDQKLEGYAKVLEQASGRTVTLEKNRVRLDCIVRGGAPGTAVSEQPMPLTLLLTTANPPYDDSTRGLAVGHTVSFQSWCAQAGLPYIDETEDSMMSGVMFSIMPDAVLKQGTPRLRSKLDRVLRNLERQTGVTFTVASREFEVWTPVVR